MRKLDPNDREKGSPSSSSSLDCHERIQKKIQSEVFDPDVQPAKMLTGLLPAVGCVWRLSDSFCHQKVAATSSTSTSSPPKKSVSHFHIFAHIPHSYI